MHTYNPETILVYGSFADETNNEASDFDALIISDYSDTKHDVSYIEGTQLDVFVHSPETFENYFSPKDFIQLGGGQIILDRNGLGEKVLTCVNDYIERFSEKGHEELLEEVDWCEKMRNRILRNDPEGFFRWHLVLTESLEVYCDIVKQYYLGPNKALNLLKENDIEGYNLYVEALEKFELQTLDNWIQYLKEILEHK